MQFLDAPVAGGGTFIGTRIPLSIALEMTLTGDTAHLSYDVVTDDGVHLGDDSVNPDFGTAALDDIVADVVCVDMNRH